MISKLYTKQRYDPPLARDQPPIAGKILWARQLFHRIEQPMQLFQQHPSVLKTPEAKPIIRSYNRMAKILLEFEVLYHRAWLQQVSLLFFSSVILYTVGLWVFSLTSWICVGICQWSENNDFLWKKHKLCNRNSFLFNLETSKWEDPICVFLYLVG